MATKQPINVTVPVCSRCKREIVCDACGKSTATNFGINHINDDLVMTPRDLCHRCYRIWRLPPEDRTEADATAVAWAEESTRNVARYYGMKTKRDSD